ncbi:putative peroxidase 4-like [Capsicum annuum]|nr:putative peroxidase 4-like [Capsicum annuum]KAF3655148.1 putative peroxidase 4-like [Capsicum annuum]
MRWHKEENIEDGVMRHLSDSIEWKSLDEHYPTFSTELRNVRLGLASDGFQPNGNMSFNYSIWLVVLATYNFPPWDCMKSPYFMMTLLIPSPKCPDNDIDVYLQPMIDELNELWNGVETYDAHSKYNFLLCVALLWTINNFPVYAAFESLDRNTNITIKWDVISWTPDGYMAVVTMKNFQMCRPIKSPGWTLEWTWSKNEVILSMVGAQTTDQGNCSKFGYNIPHSCKRNPEIVDLLPNVPFNQQRAKPRNRVRFIGAFIQKSSMEDPKFLTPYDSISVRRDSWSKEICEIRSLLHELMGNPTRSKPTPVEFPRFCGENPGLCISKAESYFDFYEIADNHKLSLASSYLDGATLSWYQWLLQNKQLVDWEHFTAKVLLRFPKLHLESLENHLANQMPSMTGYSSLFEAVSWGFTETDVLSSCPTHVYTQGRSKNDPVLPQKFDMQSECKSKMDVHSMFDEMSTKVFTEEVEETSSAAILIGYLDNIQSTRVLDESVQRVSMFMELQ